MHIEPNDLMLFAHVVDTGSFSRAADRAGLPKSTVSRRIAQLEAQLGERLLLRTTRKLTVTDFGADMLEHARSVLAEVEAVSALAQHRQAEPGGESAADTGLARAHEADQDHAPPRELGNLVWEKHGGIPHCGRAGRAVWRQRRD